MDSITSKTISFLRFPLCIAVILIHTHLINADGLDNMYNTSYPFYSNITFFITKIVAATAVPIFFLFSGFLFFNKIKEFTISSYRDKITKRSKSLLIPYLIWNFLYVIFYSIILKVKPDVFTGPRLIENFDIPNILMAFWNAGDIGNPICGPLWFIRDLMIVMLFSPLVFLYVKYLKKAFLVFFTLIIILFPASGIVGLNPIAFYFFYLGAYFSFNGASLVTTNKKYIGITTTIYTLIAIYIMCNKETYSNVINQINLILGVFSIINLTALAIKKSTFQFTPLLTSSTFFLFAAHFFPIIAVCKLSMKILHPQSEFYLICLYVICPTLIICLLEAAFAILYKFTPSLASLLSGGRISKQHA